MLLWWLFFFRTCWSCWRRNPTVFAQRWRGVTSTNWLKLFTGATNTTSFTEVNCGHRPNAAVNQTGSLWRTTEPHETVLPCDGLDLNVSHHSPGLYDVFQPITRLHFLNFISHNLNFRYTFINDFRFFDVWYCNDDLWPRPSTSSDIKPENLLISCDDVLKLCDFGENPFLLDGNKNVEKSVSYSQDSSCFV